LKKFATEGGMLVRFEEYIARLIYHIPLPQRSFAKRMRIFLPGIQGSSLTDPFIQGKINYRTEPQEIMLNFPSNSQLPAVNKDTINDLFRSLSVDNVLLLFKRVLLDTSNLFTSEDPIKLVNCCEAIKALIFPFKFELVYVPHLPEILLDRVETPFIFMLGIAGKALYNSVEDTIKDGTYIIELDHNKIFQRPHASTIINRSGSTKEKIDEDLPDLPFYLYKKLHGRIEKYGNQTRNAKKPLNDEDVDEIREAFFEFFYKLLRLYEQEPATNAAEPMQMTNENYN